MFKFIKKVLIGAPLRNEAIASQRFSVLTGLPILSSDPLSSVAYASEEILIILVPVIGALAYRQLAFISGAIILLLFILIFSYRQTIEAYPSGGGAFVVASDNLGVVPGLTAGAALSVDYILTAAVSTSSGVAAITSAFPALYPYTVPLCLAVLVLIMLGNLRGIRESARIFSIPTYAFIVTILITIVVGVVRYAMGIPPAVTPAVIHNTTGSITILLMLTAFSNGCAALTGVEAVSNAVPVFNEPQVKNAKRVLGLLGLCVFLLFGGVSLLAVLYHAVHQTDNTVLSQIAAGVYGRSVFYYIVQAVTALILIMAANTSYSGFPLLMSIIAKDGYAPRQLCLRGDRLSYSNGILALTVVAAVLIIAFQGNTNALIPLYSVGVFISFTLSQFGMFKRWLKNREGHWKHKAVINGIGALTTAVVVLIVGTTKFASGEWIGVAPVRVRGGAWIVIVVIPLLVILMLRVKKHYNAVAKQLRMSPQELSDADVDHAVYQNRVIVPVESVNRASIRALRYAETISDNVVAFNVSINRETGEKVRKRYAMLHTKVPLYIKYSPYRKIVDPLLEFIESEEYNYKKGDMITVILPEFEVRHRWQRLLHNGSGRYIVHRLLRYKHIVVSTMPLQLAEEGLLFRHRQE